MKEPYVGPTITCPVGTRLKLHGHEEIYVVTEGSNAAPTNLLPEERAERQTLQISPHAHSVEVSELAHVDHQRPIPRPWITRGMARYIRQHPESGIAPEAITAALRRGWRQAARS